MLGMEKGVGNRSSDGLGRKTWKGWNLTTFGQIHDNWYICCAAMCQVTNKSLYCMPTDCQAYC